MTGVRPPIADRDDAFFWEGAAHGELLIQRCAACSTLRHPPAPMCARCGSLEHDAVRATGRGTIYSWVVSHHPTEPDAEPRIVILVDLEEGTRLVSNLVDTDPDQVRTGLAVEAVFRDHGEVTLPQFRLSGTAPHADRTPTAAATAGRPALAEARPRHRVTGARRAVIAGIGQTEFSQDSGRSTLQLAAEASSAAITDAGLSPTDIDGTVTFSLDTNDELALMRSLGIPEVRFAARTRGGGGGACATVQLAAAAVESGQADAVVVYRAFNERSQHRFGQPVRPTPDPAWNFARPFGLDTPAKVYALSFQRYMHAFGLTNADFGRYSVVARDWAATNPRAQFFERPITLDDHQASRWIVEPILRKLDCCLESDGGVALVVTTAERAADLDTTAVPIVAATATHLEGGHEMFAYYDHDLAEYPEGRVLGQRLYADAGITADDIDVALIYENFSPIVFLQLEAFGFCGRGEAAGFVADGHIGRGGSLPVNTNGGLLGEGYIHGMNNILEAVRQLRGTAPNQMSGTEHVLVSAGRSGLILGPTTPKGNP